MKWQPRKSEPRPGGGSRYTHPAESPVIRLSDKLTFANPRYAEAFQKGDVFSLDDNHFAVDYVDAGSVFFRKLTAWERVVLYADLAWTWVKRAW